MTRASSLTVNCGLLVAYFMSGVLIKLKAKRTREMTELT